jgi:hypothetical protein
LSCVLALSARPLKMVRQREEPEGRCGITVIAVPISPYGSSKSSPARPEPKHLCPSGCSKCSSARRSRRPPRRRSLWATLDVDQATTKPAGIFNRRIMAHH